ncbi:MAG TPA: alpha/beta hydrolase [Terriglobales bacterium]|jgi:acetyl esterase/lipase|nr:alpha/beta hydrolase [Terriglobales bacterium]
MRTTRRLLTIIVPPVIFLLVLVSAAWGQLSDAERAVVTILHDYEISPNITYIVANNFEAKLDVYRPRSAKSPVPVVMFIHGGGWVGGTKEDSALALLPYLHMGFAAVNVEYRLGKVSLAPAAAEDCLCAVHWVGVNAKKYNFDLNKVIVTGGSAGGHLALTTAMIPASAGFESECAYQEDESWSGPWTDVRPRVAAVVNWFGITDVVDMLQGAPNTRSYAVSWLGSLPNREDLAKRLSPLTYVRAGLPPILTIHGDADHIVPYSHAVRLHEALNKVGVKNQLFTIAGGGHGDFTLDQEMKAYEAIHAFLAGLGITAVSK